MKRAFDLPHDHLINLFLHSLTLYTLSDRLKQLILSLNIDKSLLLLLLDPKTLIDLGLTNKIFEKRIIRANTTLLYKQKRFNLLREESEGYSKLLVEIYSAAYSRNNLQKAENTASTILSLIGYFDLDPVKALDVFLDISASNLVAHSQFFLKVLRLSPWWPSKPCIPTSIEEIGDGGNEMAAQILGFKLQSLVENNDSTPENLIMLIAVLIKEGFISLGALYPYLDPPEKTLLKIHTQWKTDMSQKVFMSGASALAMAAPLTDEVPNYDNQPQKSQEKEEPAKREPFNYPSYQKVNLLRSLLAVGAIYPSLFMLARLPQVIDPYPEVADVVLRIVEYSIEKLYNANYEPTGKNDILAVKSHSKESNHRGPLKRGLVPIPPKSEPNPTRFFYESWVSDIEQVTDVEGLRNVSNTFLKLVGPLLSRNPNLIVKLCRIGASLCNKDSQAKPFWIDYTRNFILPSISLLDPNPGITEEIFILFRHFPFETRYSLYGEWQSVILKSSPHLKYASSKAEKDTKNVLKRISNTNVKEMMKQLAKISFSNPLSCFKVFVGQVESYDNLASLVVEAARYFTDLGWDVFPFVILIQMTSGRGTQQMDGLNDRKWIQCKFYF